MIATQPGGLVETSTHGYPRSDGSSGPRVAPSYGITQYTDLTAKASDVSHMSRLYNLHPRGLLSVSAPARSSGDRCIDQS